MWSEPKSLSLHELFIVQVQDLQRQDAEGHERMAKNLIAIADLQKEGAHWRSRAALADREWAARHQSLTSERAGVTHCCPHRGQGQSTSRTPCAFEIQGGITDARHGSHTVDTSCLQMKTSPRLIHGACKVCGLGRKLPCAELQKQHHEMERSLEAFCKDQAAALERLCTVR